MANIKIKFVFDRHHKANKDKKGSVSLRLTQGKAQKFISIGIMIYPNQWDEKTESVRNCVDSSEYNMVLNSFKSRALRMIAEQVDEGALSLTKIQGKLRHDMEKPDLSFIEYVKIRANDKQVREGTKKHFISFIKFLEDWGEIVSFSEISESNIRKMDEFLKKQGKALSTIYGYHKHLKQFINDAVVDGYLKENIYTTRRIKIERGYKENVDSITESQLNQLVELEITQPYLEKARDLFLFQCYTGLAYSDMMDFKIDDFKQDEEGVFYTIGNRRKTGSAYSLVLIKPAIAILEKYKFKIPYITNQKYNMFLKAIGAMIGEPKLHSHMGRGTFASIALNHGISIDVLQHMVGHKQRSQTQRYAKMWNDTIKKSFEKLNEEL